MAEFGNQIDIGYEIWLERNKDGKFIQASVGEAGYHPLGSLTNAVELLPEFEEFAGFRGRHFIVEVVSVRTEFGVEVGDE